MHKTTHRALQAEAMRYKFYKRVLDYSIDRYQTSLKHRRIAMAMMYGASPRKAYGLI